MVQKKQGSELIWADMTFRNRKKHQWPRILSATSGSHHQDSSTRLSPMYEMTCGAIPGRLSYLQSMKRFAPLCEKPANEEAAQELKYHTVDDL